MSPKSEEQFKAIRDEKKTLILNVALELFSEKGYSATSISDIASHAKISKGLTYNYFKSKEDLLLQLFKIGVNQAIEAFDENKDGILTSDEMRLYITEVFRLLKEQTSFWKLYFNLFTQPMVYELIKQEITAFSNSMNVILTEYFRNRGAAMPEIETVVFGALMDGVSFQYITEPDLFPLNIVKENIIQKYC